MCFSLAPLFPPQRVPSASEPVATNQWLAPELLPLLEEQQQQQQQQQRDLQSVASSRLVHTMFKVSIQSHVPLAN